MQGLTVNLPEGYTGLVLHGAEEGARKRDGAPARADRAARGEGPRGTRRTRRGSQQEAKVIDADVGAGGAEPEGEDRGEGTRALRPAARFASFVLWNQDIPVDEGRDEYLRALREWTRLAAEVSARVPGLAVVKGRYLMSLQGSSGGGYLIERASELGPVFESPPLTAPRRYRRERTERGHLLRECNVA